MDPARFKRLSDIFAQARDLPVDRRAPFVAKACGDDAALRNEVEALLHEDGRQAHDAIDQVLSHDGDLAPPAGRSQPEQIGNYRILRICGTGGMGTVYEAEQHAPRRRVALKVMHAGSLRPELRRRFRREIRILAKLQHPGIAEIYEAGEYLIDGMSQPFFAMEFVDGQPLLDFATKHALDLTRRIEIFVDVCRAIHYAHQQGVVHRDLKPDNIFVVEAAPAQTGRAGRPKILDFGVGRLTGADTQVTMATEAGQLLGSVPYMSPEQALGNGEAIDGRSDIYCLGVVLFELLTGRLPYAVRGLVLADALHTIRHDEPSRLGTANPELRGDVETIVGKCLQKERDRRYDSAAALAEDLQRFLRQEPIAAQPPSTWYQFRKFAYRNRVLVGGIITTALALTAGTILSLVLAVQATRNENTALENQARSEREAYRANIVAASALLDSDPRHARRLLEKIPAAVRGWEWRYLASALSGLLLEFGSVTRRANDRFLNALTEDMYLLDGGTLVIALQTDTRFGIWDTNSGRLQRTLDAPARVGLFGVARNGNLVAAALADGSVVVTNPVEAGGSWSTWWQGEEQVDAIAVAPAGDRIAIALPSQLRFGRPGAWQVAAERHNHFEPPALAFCDDGTRLVALPGLRTWDLATGHQVQGGIESAQLHVALAFGPDAGRAFSGQMRREIRCFDLATGKLDFELLGHGASITHVAYGKGNRLVSVCKEDGTIRIWDLEQREQTAILDAPNTTKAEFIGDDHVLSLTDGRFCLWTLRERRTRQLVGHQDHVFDAVFSGDGDLLATSAPWGDTLVWDPLETSPLHRLRLAHAEQLVFDRRGEGLFSASSAARTPWTGGTTVAVTAEPIGIFHRCKSTNTLDIDGGRHALPRPGLTVFRTEHAVGQDARLPRTWCDGTLLALERAAPAHAELGSHPTLFLGEPTSMEFNGRIAELLVFAGSLSASEGAAVDAYLTARRAGSDPDRPDFAGPGAAGLIAHFKADAATVAHEIDGNVSAWTATNDKQLRLHARGRPASAIRFQPAATDAPAAVAFVNGWGNMPWLEGALPGAADQAVLTVCWLGSYGAESVTQTAYRIGASNLPLTRVDRDERTTKLGGVVCFSPDGRYSADTQSARQGGPLRVRDVATGQCVAQFDGAYFGVGFHPDGVHLACGDNDGNIDVFDLGQRQRVVRIPAHTGPCWDVAFSPDGSRLASAGNDNALRLWSATTFEPLLELPGHRSYVRGTTWSPDGTMLVSVSGDYGVRVWDAVSRSERYAQVLRRRGFEAEVRAEVEALYRTAAKREDALAEIRRLWAHDANRRRAAQKVLARLP